MDKEELRSRTNVRKMTHEDHDAVMKLASSETFRDGFDYLPAKFHQYVDDPSTVFYLTEIDGEAASANVVFLLDDGDVVLAKTIRLAPKWAGRRLFRTLWKLFLYTAVPDALQRLGKIPNTIRGMGEEGRDDVADIYKGYNFSTVQNSTIDMAYFQCGLESLGELLARTSESSLPTLAVFQPGDLSRLLPPAFSSAILCEALIFVDWDPYKLSDSNMKKFVESGCYILVDQTKPAAKSLSFGGSYMTPRGRVYHIDVHCRDEALCKAHIINHVKNACSKYTGLITFCIMVIDQALKETVMKYSVEDLAISHLPIDHSYSLSEGDFKAAIESQSQY